MKGENSSGVMSNKDGKCWEMWGIPLFGRGKEWVLKEVETILSRKGKNYWIATVNPEFMMAVKKDAGFKAILLKTDLNIIDGIGLIWARETQLRITNYKLQINKTLEKLLCGFKVGVEILRGKHREDLVTGADLMDSLCQLAEAKGKTVYFYGGWDDRSKRTAEYFLRKYPKLKVAGYRAEDFDFKTETDILFVARAMKKQEEWINEHFDKLRVKVVMGVGRSFDYYSGDLKRAPEWVRKMGLEWLYSLYREPKRWKRQLELPKFVWKVLTEKEIV
jgi:N-acetylglucosaminyldiphosphoundecaprenol N-acetyl-beta-D-mannosaminyltransferase